MASPAKRVELFYDVVSPYSWIAFETLCRYRNVWNIDLKLKPLFLSGIMNEADNKPPGTVPNKAAYMDLDVKRLAKHYQIPLKMPESPAEAMFIKGTLQPMRFLAAVDLEKSHLVESLSRSLWMRIWHRAAVSAGLTEEQAKNFIGKMRSDEVKKHLRKNTDEAMSYQAFGSPTIVVEDANKKKHMVFGSDRMHIIADILGEKYQGPLVPEAKL